MAVSPDESVDVVISNCVINLSADKAQVLREAFRVLHPGGRFAVSDVVVRGTIAPEVRASVEAWVGCVAGALEEGGPSIWTRAAPRVFVGSSTMPTPSTYVDPRRTSTEPRSRSTSCHARPSASLIRQPWTKQSAAAAAKRGSHSAINRCVSSGVIVRRRFSVGLGPLTLRATF
jgi:SAM-dependent methyltransferase